jgi:hypothetical protein
MSSETSQDQPTSPASPLRLWGPVIVVLLMIAWSNIPPYRAQVKDEKRALFVWHWRLYEQGGANVCDVRYYDMNKGGEPIERWELLGYDRPGKMPDKLARTHHKQLFSDYARVCKAMREAGDPDPNVRVYARCGLEAGWKEVERRKRNVCKISSNKPKATPKLTAKPAKSP